MVEVRVVLHQCGVRLNDADQLRAGAGGQVVQKAADMAVRQAYDGDADGRAGGLRVKRRNACGQKKKSGNSTDHRNTLGTG